MLCQLCHRIWSKCWQQFKLKYLKLKLNKKLKKSTTKTSKKMKTKTKMEKLKNLKLNNKMKKKNSSHLLIFIEKWLNVHILIKWKIYTFQMSAKLKLTILSNSVFGVISFLKWTVLIKILYQSKNADYDKIVLNTFNKFYTHCVQDIFY